MSAPPMYSQQRSGEPGASEDCRDFLRTGRCKYGASCKYNHPSNVQSGGGLKGPIDPNEPMFPIRPNEPICQYYAKHGTCKFGQACKFNHPPQSQGPLKTVLNGSNSGTTVMLNIGRNHEGSQPIIVNQVATDSNGNLLMLQFLPQRPDEPDCIYFLKNGRCKYGGTCRYHHPIHFQSQQHQQQRRSQQEGSDMRRIQHDQPPFQAQNVQYVSQVIPGSFGHQNTSQSSENQVTFLMDGSGLPQGFKPVQIVAANERMPTPSYGIPVSEAAGSSASSLASSYETAGSTMERQLSTGDMNNGMNTSLWSHQVRRNGSGSSLNAYSVETPTRGKQVGPLHNVASEGNIRQRHRAGSYGSDCNGSQYDTSTMTSSTSLQSMSRNTSAGSWRNERPADPSRRPPHLASNQYSAHAQSSPSLRGQEVPRRNSPRNRSQRSEENFEGITMMTSALLNLLDTPEEGLSGVSFDDNDDQRYPTASFQPSPSSFEGEYERRMTLEKHRGSAYHTDPPPGLEIVDHRSGSSWTSTMHGQEDQHHHHRVGSQLHHRMTDHSTSDSNVGLYLP